jgi:serine/threonine protein kinase
MNNGCLSDYFYGNKKLTLFQKYNILIDICNGMSFLHSLSTPIVHRGINYT